MELFSGLIGGFGIGTLLTSVVTHFMARRASIDDRWYNEKREAYLGLVAALQSVSGDFPVWHARCALFGSPETLRYAKQVADTPPNAYDARNAAFQKMLEAMRADLRR
jgi:hypothetical protein